LFLADIRQAYLPISQFSKSVKFEGLGRKEMSYPKEKKKRLNETWNISLQFHHSPLEGRQCILSVDKTSSSAQSCCLMISHCTTFWPCQTL